MLNSSLNFEGYQLPPSHTYIYIYYFHSLFNNMFIYIYVYFYSLSNQNRILWHISGMCISGLIDWVIPLCSLLPCSLVCSLCDHYHTCHYWFNICPLCKNVISMKARPWLSCSLSYHQPLTKWVVYRKSLRSIQWIELKLKFSILFVKGTCHWDEQHIKPR